MQRQRKPLLKIGLSLVFTVGALFFVMSFYNKQLNERSPAHEKGLRTTKNIFKHTSKLKPSLEMSIESNNLGPGIFEVSPLLKSKNSLISVKYSWIIPKELDVLSGVLEDDIDYKDFLDIKIKLENNSADINHKVFLKIEAQTNNGDSLISTAQFNSLYQELINQEKSDIVEKSLKFKKNSGHLKVFY